MAKKKANSTKKRRSTSKGNSNINGQSIFMDIGLAIGSFLITNYASKTIKGEKSIDDTSTMTLLAPQAIGIASPFLIRSKARLLRPVAIGSGIAMLLGLIEKVPKDAETKAKAQSMALINGEGYANLDEDVIDLSDLSPEEQNLLGKYIMTGSAGGNKDPLGKYVMTGDNKDPLA